MVSIDAHAFRCDFNVAHSVMSCAIERYKALMFPRPVSRRVSREYAPDAPAVRSLILYVVDDSLTWYGPGAVYILDSTQLLLKMSAWHVQETYPLQGSQTGMPSLDRLNNRASTSRLGQGAFLPGFVAIRWRFGAPTLLRATPCARTTIRWILDPLTQIQGKCAEEIRAAGTAAQGSEGRQG